MLGGFAKDREEQVIEWAMENPYTSFSAKGICKELYKDDERFTATEAFVLNDIDTVRAILQKENQ